MTTLVNNKNNVSIEGNLNAAKTLVFAHGFGTDKNAWNWVKDAFAADYRLVLYDNVGGGNADPDAYDAAKYARFDAYADDMLAILTQFELEGATIIVHSVSSMITTLAAIKQPKYFSKLVFIGASPRYLDDDTTNYTGGFDQPTLNSMYKTMTNNYYGWAVGFSDAAMANPDKPELVENFVYTLSAIRPDIALEVAKSIFESDIRSEIGKLKNQVLLLQSSKDIAVPEEVAHYLHKNIAGSKLEMLSATGHFPHITDPDEVVKHIKNFI